MLALWAGRSLRQVPGTLLAAGALALAAPGLCQDRPEPQPVADPEQVGEAIERARRAYDAALAAAQRGDLARSAQLFALADQLTPNAVTLTSALQAAVQADDPALGMELAERAATREPSEQLSAAAAEARTRFEQRAGKLRLSCGKATSCRAKLDGRPAAVEVDHWVVVGPHEVVFQAAGRTEQHRVEASPGTTMALKPQRLADATPNPTAAPSKPSAPPTPRADSSPVAAGGGISPVWFWVGLGVTAAAGTATIISAVDTQNLHDEYEQTGQSAEDGEASQLRTNILFFSTLGLAVATAAVGLFAVQWSSSDAAVQASIQPHFGGASLSLGGHW